MSPIDASIALGVRPPQFDSPMQSLAQIAQLQSLQEHRRAQQQVWQQQEEERQVRIEQRRETLAGQDVLSAATKAGLNEDGTFNIDKIRAAVVNSNYGHLMPKFEEELLKANDLAGTIGKKHTDFELARRDAIGSAAASVLPIQEPEAKLAAMQLRLAQLVKLRVLDKDDAASYVERMYTDFDKMDGELEAAIRNSPEQMRIRNEIPGPLVVPADATVRDRNDPTKVLVQGTPSVNLQEKDIVATFPDGTTYTGKAGFNPKTGTYSPAGGTTPFPAGTKIKDAPAVVDPNLAATREITAQLARMQLAAGGLTPSQQATEVNSLRNSWNKAVAPTLERRGAVAKLDTGLTALAAGNRNSATQIIVTAFNKLQDELSVVREGEYLRSEQGQSILSRIQGALLKFADGGAKLTDAELRELANEAKNVAKAVNDVHETSLWDNRQAIEESLDAYKIPHTRVFGNSDIGKRSSGGGPVPPNVAAALAGVGPGIHTLSDGSKWKKDANGVITSVP